jgi:Protein of unknown function (DUF1501)
MKLSRRQLLNASLGLSQMSLLSGLSGSALAQNQTGPSKLLTIYLQGGWMSPFALVPYTAADVATVFPTPFVAEGEPIFATASQIKNLDGSVGPGKMAVAALYDESELKAGRPDRRQNTSPNGWSWKQHQLHNNSLVIHGVDQGAVAHVAGSVSALCGVASSEFKSPAINALVAHHLYAKFPDRPIPSVWISGLEPASLSLRSEAVASRIETQQDVDLLFSDRAVRPWENLRARDINSQIPPVLFSGAPAGTGFVLNPMEDRAMRRLRSFKGQLTPSSESVLEKMHNDLVGVSKILARDVAAALQKTPGVEHLPVPFWGLDTTNYFGLRAGSLSDTGEKWNNQLGLALKFLKSDLTSSVAVGLNGASDWYFDRGHTENHPRSFIQARAIFEVLGRFLGEMKATPGSYAGKSLLDDCLVLVVSDFSRTLPKFSASSDHWADNSVIMAGGGLKPNQALGGYVVPARPAAEVQGHEGQVMAIQESAGVVMRRPRSADVITTALALLGISGVRIPGGSGEILGVR